MRHLLCHPSLRRKLALLILFALVTGQSAPAAHFMTRSMRADKVGHGRTARAAAISPHEAPALSPMQAPSDFIRQITLPTNDLVYDRQTQKLYASVPSSAGSTGNSITPIDPVTGEVGSSVFVGSEPDKLALSDDGSTLYVGLDGASAVRRFDTASQAPGLQFPLGQDPNYGTYYISDMAVAPGNPNLIAVARLFGSVSPPEAGVAVFDNGVQRPNTTGPGDRTQYIAFSASASKLYGSVSGEISGLNIMTVDNSGVSITGTTSSPVGGKIQYDNGLIYSSTGQVINPDTGTLLGTFSGVGSGPFVIDSSVGRAYFLTGNQIGDNPSVTLTAYDLKTFVPVGSLTIPGANGDPSSLVRWGANGLAFRTSTNQLFLIQTSLIPSSEPIPTPTPTPSPTPTPTPTPVALSVRQVSLPTNDLIYNPATQTIYASVPSSAGSNGNSITQINPATGEIGHSVFVGSEPNRLALSDNNQALYVGLDGAAAVRRFDTASQTAGLQFSLGNDPNGGPIIAEDIAVMPGNSDSIAVARIFNNPNFGGAAGVAIYDNGVPRQKVANSGNYSIQFSSSPTRLYSVEGNTTSNSIDKLSVDQSGVTADGSSPAGSGGFIKFSNGLLYTSNGTVVDPEAGVLKGSFTGLGGGSEGVVVDPSLGRIFFLTSQNVSMLSAYDINTFLPLGSVAIPDIGPILNNKSLIRWGANGLAFRTGDNRVFLIQTSLVSSSAPVPTPTPTPSPTPTPTPAYIPTFTRQIALPADDIIYDQQTQKLYASVPSSAGSTTGNSITPIDPATGEVGSSVFVGSEPDKLALSDDGSTLYVGLNGGAAVRSFDIASQSPGGQFSISNAPFGLNDMAVVPGSPQSVAVVGGGSVTIYDNGVPRPNASSNQFGIGFIAFSSSPKTLYGYGSNNSLNKLAVDSNGAIVVSSVNNLIGRADSGIQFANGLLYATSGEIVDPEAQKLIGTFQWAGPAMAIDSAAGRVFFAVSSGSDVIINAYDINTFLPLGSTTIPNINGTPTRLVRWGVNGLALRTINFPGAPDSGSKVFLVQTDLVSTAAPIPTAVQFTSTNYAVDNQHPSIDISVTRTGDVSQPSTIDYATSDGTASQRSDYTAAFGTLSFAPGELTKTFTILITDNPNATGTKTINLTLSNASGALLTDPTSAVLTIQNFSSGNPNTNPIDDPQFFVTQHYNDFLNRVPDQAGLNFWINQITSCNGDTSCIDVKRQNVSAAYFLSREFQETGFYVIKVQRAAFGHLSQDATKRISYQQSLRDSQAVGKGFVDLQPGADAILEENKTAYAQAVVTSANFVAQYPSTLTASAYVDALFTTAGVTPTSAERQDAISLFGSGDVAGRAAALRKVAESDSMKTAEFNPAFVLLQYFGYLRRNPTDAPDTSDAGYQFWLKKLTDANGDYIGSQMVRSFIVSSEYRKRFGNQ